MFFLSFDHCVKRFSKYYPLFKLTPQARAVTFRFRNTNALLQSRLYNNNVYTGTYHSFVSFWNIIIYNKFTLIQFVTIMYFSKDIFGRSLFSHGIRTIDFCMMRNFFFCPQYPLFLLRLLSSLFCGVITRAFVFKFRKNPFSVHTPTVDTAASNDKHNRHDGDCLGHCWGKNDPGV